MNEKNNRYFIFICGFIIGVFISGIIAGVIFERSSGEIAELNRQRYILHREYTERQRVLENHIENAERILDRTESNSGAAISDLRQASIFIRQGIEEREALKAELNNLRSSLHRG